LLPNSTKEEATLMETVAVAHARETRGPLMLGLPISVANHGAS